MPSEFSLILSLDHVWDSFSYNPPSYRHQNTADKYQAWQTRVSLVSGEIHKHPVVSITSSDVLLLTLDFVLVLFFFVVVVFVFTAAKSTNSNVLSYIKELFREKKN